MQRSGAGRPGAETPPRTTNLDPMGLSRSEQRRDAVFACYQRDVTGRPLSVLVEGSPDFTRELAEGVDRHRAEIDAVISERSHGWELDRIAPLERNLLRVALFEMQYRDDVPDEVAIDEAVGLARKYCGSDAPGFINGILGSVVRAEKGAA